MENTNNNTGGIGVPERPAPKGGDQKVSTNNYENTSTNYQQLKKRAIYEKMRLKEKELSAPVSDEKEFSLNIMSIDYDTFSLKIPYGTTVEALKQEVCKTIRAKSSGFNALREQSLDWSYCGRPLIDKGMIITPNDFQNDSTLYLVPK